MFEILDAARYVANQSHQVRIDRAALTNFAQTLAAKTHGVPHWDNVYHYRGSNEETIFYLLVLDSVNFCFWPLPGKTRWEIEHRSNRLSGYYGLAVALKQAAEVGIPITKADFLAQLTLDQLKQILGGRGELPLLAERVENLRELGQLLLRDYDGRALPLLEAAGKSAPTLVRLLGKKLSSFRDVSTYEGHKVFFYKRAQLFAADLYGAFDGKGWGDLKDMEKLTAFADYKLPQVLRHLGIFDYAQPLARNVDQQIHLEAGSHEEVEIRANTIWAVELIRQELNQMGRRLGAFEIDWILWNLGQRDEFRLKPYHRTLTIFY